MNATMDYGELAEDACPICGQDRCSLSTLRERLTPLANFAARVLARACLWSGGTILVAIAAGWITP